MSSVHRLYLDLQILQDPVRRHRSIGRFHAGLARTLLREPSSVAALALDPGAESDALPPDLASAPQLVWRTAETFRALHARHPLTYVVAAPRRDVDAGGPVPPRFVVDHDAPVVVVLDDASVEGSGGPRLEMIRQADHVLTLSERTRTTAIAELDLDAGRVSAIGAAADELFREPFGDEQPSGIVATSAPAITRRFVLSVADAPGAGAAELVDAWARLRLDLRDTHQLVILCDPGGAVGTQLRRRAADVGMSPDEISLLEHPAAEPLRALYQEAALFVGFADDTELEALEAARCGCPVLVTGATAVPELLDFAGAPPVIDTADIGRLLERALVDPAFRHELVECSRAATHAHSWDRITARVARALALVRTPSSDAAPPPRVALIAPLSRHRGTLGAYGSAAADALATKAHVDVFSADRGPDAEARRWSRFPVRALGGVRAPADYDALFYLIGDERETDAASLRAARRHPGVVWTMRPDSALLDEVVPSAHALITGDRAMGAALRLRYGPEPGVGIGTVPKLRTRSGHARTAPRTGEPFVVAALGDTDARFRPETFVAAMSLVARQVRAQAVLVRGPDGPAAELIQRFIEELELDATIQIVSPDDAGDALAGATCAVALATQSPTSTMPDIDHALSLGLPVITNVAAAARPGGAEIRVVPPDPGADALSIEIVALLRDDGQLARAADAARATSGGWEPAEFARQMLALGRDHGARLSATDVEPVAATAGSPAFGAADGATLAATLAPALLEPITVVDVGCRWGFADVWAALGDRVRLVGFDPDVDECRRLRELYADRPGVQLVPAALASAAGTATLHVTDDPACSSLYPPAPVVEQYPYGAPMRLVSTETVVVTTLDDWSASAAVGPVDVLKLDVQGAELDVLEGAETVLPAVRALEVEVELNELYTGQPLFGDVDRFLRRHGFVLWRLGHLVHYSPDGTGRMRHVHDVQYFDDAPVGFAARGGQVHWGMAYYVHAEMTDRSETDAATLVRDAVVTAALGLTDLADLIVEQVRSRLPRSVVTALGEIGH